MLVEVALPVPARDGLFTYRAPPAIADAAVAGRRAVVQLGKRLVTGVILGPAPANTPTEKVRDLVRLLDEGPLLPADVIQLVRFAAGHYLSPVGQAIRAALPPGIDVRDAVRARLTDQGAKLLAGDPEGPLVLPLGDAAGAPRKKLEALLDAVDRHARGEDVDLPKPAQLAALQKRGLVELDHVEAAPRVAAPQVEIAAPALDAASRALEVGRAPKQAAVLTWLLARGAVPVEELTTAFPGARVHLKKLAARGLVLLRKEPAGAKALPDAPWGSARHEATPAQAAALATLASALDAPAFAPFLLHGVTGSGKTWVYLEAIAHARAQGRGALVLVPEIALTPQLAGRFRARFGDEVAVLHSGLTDRERLGEWRRVREGRALIAVGARSAVFAPVQNLGIVVVDEEHEPSYKQEERLRYHARDLALVRAQRAPAVIVLGSATPSLETLRRAQEGKLVTLRLPERVDGRPLPAVTLIDLKTALPPPAHGAPLRLLTPPLVTALEETLGRGEQAILFLNRRGHTTSLICLSCGAGLGCPNCSVALVLHKGRGGEVLRCHLCGHAEPPRQSCPQCGGQKLLALGGGTERVEEELAERLPSARIGRLDRDAASSAGQIATRLARFARRELDVLVGTQMVAKGHDFPGVTLVGVLNADSALHLPDFRAAERCVQLLAQVAGRAGRGEQPGRVLIQALRPEEPAVQIAAGHDLEEFARSELERRRVLSFPPYTRLAALRLSGNVEPKVRAAAEALAEGARRLIAQGEPADVLGPASSPLARLRGKHRWQLVLRAADHAPLHRLALRLRAHHQAKGPDGVELSIDVDPMSMM